MLELRDLVSHTFIFKELQTKQKKKTKKSCKRKKKKRKRERKEATNLDPVRTRILVSCQFHCKFGQKQFALAKFVQCSELFKKKKNRSGSEISTLKIVQQEALRKP
jgi:hypothetical protein